MSFQYRELLPHEQRAVDALKEAGCEPVRINVGNFRSTCPAHPSTNPEALVTYLNPQGIYFLCVTEDCTHTEICASLKLKPKELMRGDNGLSLSDYSHAKHIDVAKLAEYHVREVPGNKHPHIEMSYLDFDFLPVGEKQRKSLCEKPNQKNGNTPRLYGMWRHAGFTERIVIVEGESDCHTLWSHGIAAVGVPGATMVRTVLPDLEELFRRHPDLQPYVFQEPDVAGYKFVESFKSASFKDKIKVVKLERFADASELHCHFSELHRHSPASLGTFKASWQVALDEARDWNEKNSHRGASLESLAPMISSSLKKGNGLRRDEKISLCDLIADLLLQNDRLLVDRTVESNPVPYMITDTGAAVEMESGKQQFTHALQYCGMNPSEPIFGFAINHLRFRATRDGRDVIPERYSAIHGKKLYISSGPTKIVVVELVGDEPTLRLCPNGEDGVLFAAGSCFPRWQPTDAVQISSIPLLNPFLDAIDEAPGYTKEHQQLLLETWMVSRIAGVRGPILTFIGSFSNGKSAALRAISMLFDNRDLSNPPKDQRAFFTAAGNCATYMIDNLDSTPHEWFADSIASACTGVNDTGYTLFKNSVMFSKPVTAMFGVATRSAAFARRRDIQDRLLPLFTGTIPPSEKRDPDKMVDEVCKNRDGIFTYLAERAAVAMLDGEEPKGLPGRFQPFARIALSFEYEDEGEALRQCEIAKRIGVTNDDAFSKIIRDWFSSHQGGILKGAALEICDQLQPVTPSHKLPSTGKMFAIRLEESRPVLELMGFEISTAMRGGMKVYTIAKIR